MPGISIHLAVAAKYMELHRVKDRDAFSVGSIAPDFAVDTDLSHHSSPNIRDSAFSFLIGKVNLKECLSDFDINTDYGKGYFLHLITDYEYYRCLAKDEDRYRDMPHYELKYLLYHDYAVSNKYYKKKYNFVFPDMVKKYDVLKEGKLFIIDLEETDKIIEWLGSIDLEEYLSQCN